MTTEHRAHYLQHMSNGHKRFYSTCDCGWISSMNLNAYSAAQSYSRHMGHVLVCKECGK